jgi:type I restriction enzyme S subunit
MAEIKNTRTYCNTEVPIDWEVTELGKIALVNMGQSPDSENYNEIGQGLPLIQGNADLQNRKSIKRYFTTQITKVCDEGDLILSVRAPVGSIGEATFKSCIGRGVCSLKPSKVDREYLYQLLLNGENKWKKIEQGSTFTAVSSDDVRKFKLLVSKSEAEQKAIAQVLSTADSAIHASEKLITQKEQLKKWLMQNLLTGKKRLKGFESTKWKIQPLENYIKPIVREVPKPNVPYLGIGLRSHGKGTFLKHDEQPEKNSMDNFYVVRPKDLIVNITFAWEQAIAIVRPEDDGALASHRFPTYTFIEDRGHPDFFRFYILQPRMKFMLQMISPGGAGRNRVMSKSDFIKLEFLLPEYKEQTAIAQVLQAADKEISLLKEKVEKLREQKKGLMQVLLTGKVRLKV